MSGWDREQIDLIKRTVAKGTTDDEFAMFLHYCQQSGLDPLRSQAHCIVRDYTDRSGKKNRDVQMMTGIDGFRSRAERFPDYRGCQSGVVFADDEFSIDYGEGRVNHIARYPRKSKDPIGAWCVVRREGRIPYVHWIDWLELYDQRSFAHKKMPEIMARKTTEAQALRHEFPEAFSGIYDPAEIPAAGEDILKLAEEPVPRPILVSESKADGQEDQPEPAKAPKRATKAQRERFVELMGWAYDEASLVGDSVYAQAVDWCSGKGLSHGDLGIKISEWKGRKERYDSASEEVRARADDAFRQWVMSGEVDFSEFEKSLGAVNAA